MTKPTAEVERITPAMAREWLDTLNEGNRKLRQRKVEQYAHDMKSGRWRLTGEALILNGDRLLNGQHRLTACVKAGVPFETFVVRGVPTDVMPVIDKGAPRSLRDTLAWQGATQASSVSTITRRVAPMLDGTSLRDVTRMNTYSDTELLAVYDAYAEEIQWASKVGNRVWKAIGRPRNEAGVAALWIRLSTSDSTLPEIERFFGLIAEGVGLEPGSPILTLRNWAIRATAQRRRWRSDEFLIGAVKAWNAHVQGEEIRQMRVMPSEQLPTVEDI